MSLPVQAPLRVHPLEFAGKSVKDKLSDIRKQLKGMLILAPRSVSEDSLADCACLPGCQAVRPNQDEHCRSVSVRVWVAQRPRLMLC